MREILLRPRIFLARSLDEVKRNPGNPFADSALAPSRLPAGPASEEASFSPPISVGGRLRRESSFFLLRELRIITVQSFRGLRKFYRRSLPVSYRRLGLFSRQACPEQGRRDAKNAEFGFVLSFAAFAPLREIFRLLVAATPPSALCGKEKRRD